jgi:hypothetical protein
MTTLTVPSRFNGPPSSGNGGYSCGLLASCCEGPVAVSLRRPVPLDQPLEVELAEGGVFRATAGNELIAEAVPAAAAWLWTGPAVDLDAARAAHRDYTAPADGIFGHCFVCGRARGDGFEVFAGPPASGDAVASTWAPPKWSADSDGSVRPEFVWAALDCPSYFALHGVDLSVAFLVRQQVEIVIALRAGVEYIVVGHELERSGRKALAASALLDADGTVLAHGEALFVEPLA